MRQISLLFIFLMAFYFNVAKLNAVECSPSMQKHLHTLLKLQEAKDLLDRVQKEGPIKIIAKKTTLSKQFGAYWDPDMREIVIDVSTSRTAGSLIGSLLFELHNASANSKINFLNKLASSGRISKDNYVRSMEYIEYNNSLNASNIAKKGIKMGILPKEAHLPTYPTFQEHFRVQKMSGHSDCFSRNFDMCSRW